MIDLKFLRENPEVVKENIKKKFQDHKLPLVDEVIELDAKARAAQSEADELRANKNKISKQIGALMAQGKKEEAEEVKAQVAANAARLSELEAQEKELAQIVLCILTSLTDFITFVSIPCTRLADDSDIGRKIKNIPFLGNSLTEHNIKFCFLKWRSNLVLYDLHSCTVTNDFSSLL